MSQTRCVANLKPVIPDPERPKRPMTPWLMFLKDFRDQMKAKSVEIKAKQVMIDAAAKWKVIDAESKQKYDEPYKKEKALYEEHFKEYVDSGKKGAWESDPEKPKRPLSSFILFAQEYRAQHPDLPMLQQTKEAAADWKKLGEKDRAVYEKKFAAAKKKYEKDLAAYKASGTEEAWKQKVGIKALEDKRRVAQVKAKEKELKDKTRLQKAMQLVKAKLKEQEALKKKKEKEVAKKLKLKAAEKK